MVNYHMDVDEDFTYLIVFMNLNVVYITVALLTT